MIKGKTAGQVDFRSALAALMQRDLGLDQGEHWTNEALAEAVRVSVDTIGNWRSGRSLPSPANYNNLLRALKLSRDDPSHRMTIAQLDDLLLTARSQMTKREQSPLHFGSKFPSVPDMPIERPGVSAFLDKSIFEQRLHLVVLFAAGGSGKSTAVRVWISSREAELHNEFEAIFLWSFYRQGQTPEFITIEPLFDALSEFLSVPVKPSDSTRAKARGCMKVLFSRPIQLVIDGTEALQYPPGDELGRAGRFKDDDAQEFFASFARNQKSSCIITSRINVSIGFSDYADGISSWELPQLLPEEGLALLRSVGVEGTDVELAPYVDACHGHPLSLLLAGTFICRAYRDRLPSMQEISLNAPSSLPGSKLAERILASYLSWLPPPEAALLSICGIFDQPVESKLVYRLTNSLIGEQEFRFDLLQNHLSFRFHLSTLRSTGLLYTDDEDFVDTHPLIREYLGGLLQREYQSMWHTANRALFALLSDQEDWHSALNRIVFGCRGEIAQRSFDEVYSARFSKSSGTLSEDSGVPYGALLYAVNSFFRNGAASSIDAALSQRSQATLLLDAIFLITALRGYADAQLPVLFARARELHSLDEADFIRISYAECRYHRMCGDLLASKSDFERLLTIAERRNDISLKVGALRNASAYYFYVGDFDKSRHFALAGEAENYQQNWKRDRIGFVNNPNVMLAGYCALASAMLGKHDEVNQAVARMHTAAAASPDSHSNAISAFIDTILADFGYTSSSLLECAKLFERLASQGEMTQWLIAANIMKAAGRAAHPSDFRKLIRRWSETGAKLFLPYWQALAADAASKRGDAKAAIEFAGLGLSVARSTGEVWTNERLNRHLRIATTNHE